MADGAGSIAEATTELPAWRAQVREWQVERDEIEREAEDFDVEDMSRLRTVAKGEHHSIYPPCRWQRNLTLAVRVPWNSGFGEAYVKARHGPHRDHLGNAFRSGQAPSTVAHASEAARPSQLTASMGRGTCSSMVRVLSLGGRPRGLRNKESTMVTGRICARI